MSPLSSTLAYLRLRDTLTLCAFLGYAMAGLPTDDLYIRSSHNLSVHNT